ncbi:MAG: glycosyltransferase 87 family protein [Candidatus Limnocylindria bacterium]
MSEQVRTLSRPTDAARMPGYTSLARALVGLLIIGPVLAWSVQALVSGWNFVDLHVYLGAAENLVRHGNPYLASDATTDLLHYHYAPWFALLFVPLLSLPLVFTEWIWAAALLAAMVPALMVFRGDGMAAAPLAVLMGALLLGQAMGGNVQGVLLALLIWRLDRVDGPVWVGLAASLKAIPILLVLYYAGRRQWRRAMIAGVVTAILVGPMPLFDIPPDNLWPGVTGLYAISPVLWVASAIIAAGCALRLAGGRYGRLAAAVAIVAALPRLYPFDISWLLLGVPPSRRDDSA